MRFGGYIRVSSVGARDRDRFLSPTLQRDRLEGWCKTHDHQLTDVREDIDVSGGTRDRRNLIDLVEQVERGELDGVVVARLDRFARNIVHATALIERIDQAGGQFVSVADGFDTRTPYGRLALNILLSIAQFELERFREGWRESRAKLIQQGRHYGGVPPLGYRRGADGVLVPDDCASLITEMFRRRANGEGATALARWLASEGVRTTSGGTPNWRLVNDMVRNRAYLGVAFAGDFVNEEAHKPLIDRVTWERANAAIAPRPPRGTPGKLSGLVRCHGCRYGMGAAQSPSRDGIKRAYRCKATHTNGRCDAPAFALEEQLVALVEQAFFQQVGAMHAAAAGDNDTIADLTADRERARHALITFRDDPDVIDALGSADFADGLKVRRAALDDAEQRLAAEVARRPAGLPDVASLRMVWDEIDDETKRRMYAAVFDAVVVRKPIVHRSHSEPLAGRVAFVPTGAIGDVPRPGVRRFVPRPFPEFDDPAGAWISIAEPLGEDRSDG